MATERMEGLQMEDFIKGTNKRTYDNIDKDIPFFYHPSFTTGQTAEQLNSVDHPAKRSRPTQEFFRPWLTENKDTEKASTKRRKSANQPHPLIVQYHPNKVRSFPPKERSPKDQQRRDRNTLSCLLSRRARKIEQAQLEQEYLEFCHQHQSIERAAVRLNLYLQELQRMALASRMMHTALPPPFYGQPIGPSPQLFSCNCNCNYC